MLRCGEDGGAFSEFHGEPFVYQRPQGDEIGIEDVRFDDSSEDEVHHLTLGTVYPES